MQIHKEKLSHVREAVSYFSLVLVYFGTDRCLINLLSEDDDANHAESKRRDANLKGNP